MDALERARLAKRWPSSKQELVAVLTAFYDRFGREPSRKRKLQRLRPGPYAAQLVWFKPSENGVYVNYAGSGLPDTRGTVERYWDHGAPRYGPRVTGGRNKLLEAPPIA